ncbi:hypothetical protein [Pseudophaeobacter arcticus]|jgi:hypothetical protein|uniref:hypothetical protein n=1 Tax=Pseudophaeobacter arcticus TaxID=385492 RepID=UPI00040E72BB|nr:hypothetical protein [Pseudophaeobacter arcticus]
MSAFGKLTRKPRSCGMDGLALPVDDRCGQEAIMRSLDGSAQPSLNTCNNSYLRGWERL